MFLVEGPWRVIISQCLTRRVKIRQPAAFVCIHLMTRNINQNSYPVITRHETKGCAGQDLKNNWKKKTLIPHLKRTEEWVKEKSESARRKRLKEVNNKANSTEPTRI